MSHQPNQPVPIDPAELAELYAVGALTAAESADFERRLREGDEGCRREFARVRPLMEALLSAAPPMTPDASTLDAVMAQLDEPGAAKLGTIELASLGPSVASMRLHTFPPHAPVALSLAAVVVAGSLNLRDGVGTTALATGQRLEAAQAATAGPVGCSLLVAGRQAAPVAVRGARPIAAAGWLAAAAALALAAVGWFRPLTSSGLVPGRPGGDFPNDPILATVADLEQLATAAGTRTIPVMGKGRIESPKPIGEFVWNSREQRGFLRLQRFDANNPDQAQYQGWFFDAKRDPNYPVSAGLFNVAPTVDRQLRDCDGALLVPIKPDLPIGDLDAFAVTVERPGGVVVTDKKGLVLLAAPAPTPAPAPAPAPEAAPAPVPPKP